MSLARDNVFARFSALVVTPMLFTAAAHAGQIEWPSYNRTLTSERFAPLDAINTRTVKGLKVICTYDTGETTSFQTGLVQIRSALYGTTEHDTFSINPDNCRENWRAHEDFPSGALRVNRGVAYLHGKVFRGTSDGRVLAYDAASGKRLWATAIADPNAGESVTASPISWNGLVFVGNAGGDNKGVKGRMYALEAATGKIVWEFYLVPRGAADVRRGPAAAGQRTDTTQTWENASGFPITGGATWTSYTLDPTSGRLYVPSANPAPDFQGKFRKGINLYTDSIVVLDARSGAYLRHFQFIKHDIHDWDTDAAPSLFMTKSGKRMMAAASKDGHLYGFDLASGRLLYRLPVTTMLNTDAPFTSQGTRFCPGVLGGALWNGPAYDPIHNLTLTGEADWCTTVRTGWSKGDLESAPQGHFWSGPLNDLDKYITQDDPATWAGWLTATDATTGKKKWQFKAPAPLMSGVTPTAGGLVFVGDMAGNLYAFDAVTGKPLWQQNLGGAIGGGVITYDTTGAGQKIAIAAGMTSPVWPTAKAIARIVVLGLE
jgi:alcohol dehydrogenase (cytochrome c)